MANGRGFADEMNTANNRPQIIQKGDCSGWARPDKVNLIKAGWEVRDAKPRRPLLPPESLEMAGEPSWAQRDGTEVMEDTDRNVWMKGRPAFLRFHPPRGSKLH